MERKRIVSRKPKSAAAVEPISHAPDPSAHEAVRGPGRPRSGEAHDAILTAAIALVREVGYDAVAMDAIAARAGVGKATVYRRWSSKEEVVVEALGRLLRAIPAPDTGTTDGDVRAMMRIALGMYRDPATGGLLSGLVAAMARSEPIARAFRTGFVETWRQAMHLVLSRGVARGDLRPDLDVELTNDLLSGPLFHRYLLTGEPVDERVVDSVVDVVLRGLAPDGPSAANPITLNPDGGREP
jgi:AcrR family transcriptional regulator